jgi:hypothetical protein
MRNAKRSQGRNEQKEDDGAAKDTKQTRPIRMPDALLICSQKGYRSKGKGGRAALTTDALGEQDTLYSLKRLDPSTSPSAIFVAIAHTGR